MTVVRIKADMLNEWIDLQRNEVVPALKKAGIKQRTVWATAVGNAFEYTILTPFEKFALMDARARSWRRLAPKRRRGSTRSFASASKCNGAT